MRNLGIVGGLTLTLFVGAVACQTDSKLDKHWGEAQRANVDAMIANPCAPYQNTKPVEGLDATRAEIVIDKLHRRSLGEDSPKEGLTMTIDDSRQN